MADDQSAARYLAIRTKLELSQTQLAVRLGVRKQTVSSWERGVSDPRMDTAQQMAKLSGASLEWLLTGIGASGGADTNVALYVGRGRRVAIVGDTITRRSNKVRKHEYIQTYFECSARSEARTIVGDSMAPEFLPGDVVVIDPAIKPVPGDFVFVEMNDGRSLFRKYRPLSGRNVQYELVPLNPDWPIERIDKDNPAKLCGVMSERISPRRRT